MAKNWELKIVRRDNTQEGKAYFYARIQRVGYGSQYLGEFLIFSDDINIPNPLSDASTVFWHSGGTASNIYARIILRFPSPWKEVHYELYVPPFPSPSPAPFTEVFTRYYSSFAYEEAHSNYEEFRTIKHKWLYRVVREEISTTQTRIALRIHRLLYGFYRVNLITVNTADVNWDRTLAYVTIADATDTRLQGTCSVVVVYTNGTTQRVDVNFDTGNLSYEPQSSLVRFIPVKGQGFGLSGGMPFDPDYQYPGYPPSPRPKSILIYSNIYFPSPAKVYDIINDCYYSDKDLLYVNEGQTEVKLAPVVPFNQGFVKWVVWRYFAGVASSRDIYSPILTLSVEEALWSVIELYLTNITVSGGAPAQITMSTSQYHQVPYTPLQAFTETFTSRYAVLNKNRQPFSLRFTTRYTAGVKVLTVYNYQNVKTGEEEWVRVYASPDNSGNHTAAEYLYNTFVRHFFVKDNIAYFLVLTANYPYTARLLSLDLSTQQWSVIGEFTLSAPARNVANRIFPEFGSVAVGHGGVVFATTHEAFYFPLTGNGEPLRLPFVSSIFNLTPARWGTRCVLAVPEGFIFLPQAILWDMDIFWDLPTNIEVSDNDRLMPVYFDTVTGVAVRTGEYGMSGASDQLKAFYVWGGMGKGFIKAKVGAQQGVSNKAIPFYHGGSLLKNKHWAFDSSTILDEATLLHYEVIKDQQNPEDMSKWTLTLTWKQFALPLPFNLPSGIWKPPAWGELWCWGTTTNTYYLYFTRLWDRIYRLDPDTKSIALAHIIPYLDFGGNSILRPSEEEEAQMLLYYHWDEGRIYVAHLRSGGRIQIWRQSVSVTPPPAPDIIFPPNGLTVPRKFEVIFRPYAYPKPQEFMLLFSIATGQGYQNFAYYSYLHRQYFMVSWDGGNTYQPMTGAITVGANDDVRVRFDLPIFLPQSSSVTVYVYSISVSS